MSSAEQAKVETLNRLFRPGSIAILGASSREGRLSRRFIGGLQRHGFRGRIVPVNPLYDQVDDLPCFPTVTDAVAGGGPIDLALLSIPRDNVLDALEDCHTAGAAGAVIFASGFSETGEHGRLKQERLASLAQRTGFRLLGPNSPGLINVTEKTCVIASGVSFRERFTPGGLGIASQSGGVAGLMVERVQDAGVGISAAICTGNEADVTIGEVLAWFARDQATKAVAAFIEGIRKPADLIAGFEALREAGKPLVALKAGATEGAARATAAHTGSLATPDDVVDAVFARHGVVRVHGLDDLIEAAAGLERLGTGGGRRVGIVTTSGGAGVVAAEAAERAGLELPPLSPATVERVAAAVPSFASVQNPSDMSGMFVEDREIWHASLAAFAEAEEFDAWVIVLTVHPGPLSEQLTDHLIEFEKTTPRPPAVYWIAGEMSANARRRLAAAGLAVFEDADRCMRTLAARPDALRAPGPPLPPRVELSLAERMPLLESEALGALAAAGIHVPASVLCSTEAEAAAAAERIGYPVVVKAAARDLAHKSDVGAVALGVDDADAAARAHREVVEAARRAGATPEGSLIQATAPPGVELIAGARRDADFGPILVVGSGGLEAELGRGVARRLLPLRAGEAEAMLRELPTFPLLDGYRGRPRADVAAAAAAIEALAAFAVAAGERLEAVEANPLLIHPEGRGVTAVDALLLLAAGDA